MLLLISSLALAFIVTIEAIDAKRKGLGVNPAGVFMMIFAALVFVMVLLFDTEMWR